MTEYQIFFTYLSGMFGRFRDDERGDMAQTLVITGVSLVAAAVVVAILWSKLKNGANDVTVPSPAAP